MKQTAMISQPMTEISYDDILSHRKDAVSVLKNLGYDVKDTFLQIIALRHKNIYQET